MKKLSKRLLAYIIDTIVLVTLVSIITNTNAINKQLSEYNKYYDKYTEISSNYKGFTDDLKSYYGKENLSQENYDKLINDYEYYQSYISKYYDDSTLEKKEYDKLLTEIEKDYQKDYVKTYYNLAKNSTINYGVYIIITILYFVLFNLLTNGQTLGKKLMRLKVVKKDGTKPNIINYLIRSIILFSSWYYLLNIICVCLFNKDNFYTYSSIVYEIQYLLQWVIIMSIVMRKDNRGIHDLLASTKVIIMDKEGNEILENDTLFPNKEYPIKNKEEKAEVTKEKVNNKKTDKPNNKKKNKKVIDTTYEEHDN